MPPPRAARPGTPMPLSMPTARRHRIAGRHAVLRAADIAVAASLLLLTLPLVALVALAVRLDSPGPLLERLPRRGRGGQPFHLLAFRSTAPGPFGRPVPTRIGRLVRPARLDQLPVLLNLLRGDMTLVGPAPAYAHGAAQDGAVKAGAIQGGAIQDGAIQGGAIQDGADSGTPGLTGWARVEP